MASFEIEDFKISFSRHMRRFTLTRSDQWLSLSLTSMKILLSLLENDSNHNRVTISQGNSEVLIENILQNYLIRFTGRNITSTIIINGNITKKMLENGGKIIQLSNDKSKASDSENPHSLNSKKRKTILIKSTSIKRNTNEG